MARFTFLVFTLVVCAHFAVSDEEKVRVKRVIGGQQVRTGQWPWLVSLKGKFPTRRIFGIPIAHSVVYCGASLLNDRWVLTAAHCFDFQGSTGKTPRYWHARMGDTDLSASLFERVKGFVGKILNRNKWRDWNIHAEKIIIHPNYTPGQRAKWANDIALVKLKESVPASSSDVPEIQPVTLPSQGLQSFPRTGQRCIMKGWGCTRGGGRVAQTARQVSLPAVSDRECGRFWGIETNSRMCAGHNLASKGICKGDSGGPLVCQYGSSTNARWVQAGVASFTSGSSPGSVPGVFTRVAHFTNWIRRTIAAN